jgi:hypothetical protein
MENGDISSAKLKVLSDIPRNGHITSCPGFTKRADEEKNSCSMVVLIFHLFQFQDDEVLPN